MNASKIFKPPKKEGKGYIRSCMVTELLVFALSGHNRKMDRKENVPLWSPCAVTSPDADSRGASLTPRGLGWAGKALLRDCLGENIFSYLREQAFSFRTVNTGSQKTPCHGGWLHMGGWGGVYQNPRLPGAYSTPSSVVTTRNVPRDC